MAPSLQDAIDESWYLDMGASARAANNSDTLSNLRPYNGNDRLYMGDNWTLIIKYTGTHEIQTPSRNLNLKTVLLLPSLGRSLIVVSRFTEDDNCSMKFCMIKDYASQTTLANETRKGGLHSLDSKKCCFHLYSRGNYYLTASTPWRFIIFNYA